MDQKWISIIYFLSVVSVSAYVPHRYHFVNESKNWTEAQIYCRKTYTDLATINNMDEMKKLNDALKDVVNGSAWIGLKKRDTGRWQWSLGGFYSVNDSNWNKGEPNNDGRNEFCVAMKKHKGKWLDESCGHQFPFVCFDDKKKNTKPYIPVKEEKSWHEAQRHCRLHHTDLASVGKKSERQQIMPAVKKLKNWSRVWIGLFNESWEWSDKSNASFRYWESSQPDNQENKENCTTVHTVDQGYWHDENCDKLHPFICHEDKLILIQKNLSWAGALRYCRENHVDLVSVHSEEIQLWVKDVAQEASTDHVWLGLRHTCTLSFWFWVGGESICYQNWVTGDAPEGEDCSPVERTGAVQAREDQNWVSLPENQTLNFICIKYEG